MGIDFTQWQTLYWNTYQVLFDFFKIQKKFSAIWQLLSFFCHQKAAMTFCRKTDNVHTKKAAEYQILNNAVPVFCY